MGYKIDLTGRRFGRLTVISYAGKNQHRQSKWLCRCDCGKETVTLGAYLTVGDTKSCGCLFIETSAAKGRASVKHGGMKERLHRIWTSMLTRCRNRNSPAYRNYGGRGINVCDEWLSYVAFRDWAYANGYDDTAPRGQFTLDRIDVNGNYCPENCRWITAQEQCWNLRTNVNITVDGETHCKSQWAHLMGVKPSTIGRIIRRGEIDPADYIRYRMKHIGEQYVRKEDVLAAAEEQEAQP